MNSFDNKIAVVTGGGNGMGRELVVQLANKGCHVAFCDLNDELMQETLAACRDAMDRGTRVTAHRCDVASEDDLMRFRSEVEIQHDTNHINLRFNNADPRLNGVIAGGAAVHAGLTAALRPDPAPG